MKRLVALCGVVAACAGPALPPAPPRPEPDPCAQPRPQYSAQPVASVEVRLPPVPKLPDRPVRDGEAYTVWGASYLLRSRMHHADVTGKRISITGFIVATTLPDAPACAVHRAGVGDPEGCRPNLPAFWIGDTPDAPRADAIKVLGWASNYAQIYDAIRHFDGREPGADYADEFWGVQVPNPLPAVGARVTVQGTYGALFTLASTGVEVDPIMGVLTYAGMTVREAAPELATLPGVARKGHEPVAEHHSEQLVP
jgi:hypothetical protein